MTLRFRSPVSFESLILSSSPPKSEEGRAKNTDNQPQIHSELELGSSAEMDRTTTANKFPLFLFLLLAADRMLLHGPHCLCDIYSRPF